MYRRLGRSGGRNWLPWQQDVYDLSSQPPSVLLHLWGEGKTMTKALQAKGKVPRPVT